MADESDKKISSPEVALLHMENITKRFGDSLVLKNVSFNVVKGEVHALLGGNGAGKSTLMKILMGVYRADEGRIRFDGADLSSRGGINDRLSRGVAMIFQELSLLPNLTVADNLFFGREPLRPGYRLNRSQMLAQSRRILDERGIDIPPKARVESLSFSQRQLVEIAKATSLGAKVLVMDEPTSSLSGREERLLFELIERLNDAGIGIVYISHRMHEIFRIADRITVLRDGEAMNPIRTADATVEKLSQLLVQTDVKVRTGRQDPVRKFDESAPPVLKVKDLSTKSSLVDIDLEIRRGEIVGVAGLVGVGRSTLAKAIAGLVPDARGELIINGKRVDFAKASTLLGKSIGFIPEDRHLEGLILEHALATNISLPSLSRLRMGGRFGIITRHAVHKFYKYATNNLTFSARGPDQTAEELSGGNQQKVVFAKWLGIQPDILILDEPTAGVDVGAKADMRSTLTTNCRDQNFGVLLINSELEELLATCDRILVMERGQFVTEVSPDIGEAGLQGLLLNATGETTLKHA